jgi:predicted enzyme related to lactoylglutathione lyase
MIRHFFKYVNSLTIFSILLLIISCEKQKDDRSKVVRDFFKGLTGVWQVEDHNSFEVWEMGPDSTFSALAYALDNGDTLSSEKIRIIQKEGKWYYEATVQGQNDNKPVLFQLTEFNDSVLDFRNETHDFPQAVKYQIINDKRMRATISGKINDESKTYVFNYIRHMKKKKVTGVGGIFFKSDNPKEIIRWYGENLGLVTSEYGSLFEFRQSDNPDKKGYLQWGVFPSNTEYFDPSDKEFMINFRVENIEELVEELKKNGVTVLDSIETYPYGKFVHILDPENNKIELWEPVDNDFTENYEGETTK